MLFLLANELLFIYIKMYLFFIYIKEFKIVVEFQG